VTYSSLILLGKAETRRRQEDGLGKIETTRAQRRTSRWKLSTPFVVHNNRRKALARDESFVFFKIAEGYGSHTQNLALFEASNTMFLDNKAVQLNSQETTLHHIALNVALEDFESEKKRLEGLGLKVDATVHEWLHVRSLYFPDPEGNLLEFACYDASVG